jgi:serine/threonine protein kinase/dipeptidyl aminopeptidase/acylaminoacyl peptidase
MPERIEQVQRAFTAYTVEQELGSGGMATVYLAHDKKHDRKVAIKILRAELAAVLGAERFLQEIRVTANLQHPHILGLIDSGLVGEEAGELQGRPYYVMPYVDGESLRQRLDKEQQLPISDSVRIATEVASALDYAHRHGVVHRDIKPENILLHDGSAVVADFGIALALTQAGGERLTRSGVSLGTPTYMSPEQAAGERTITGRSDIYSLGAVTYEMLSGEPPFTGPTAQAIVARALTEDPRPLTTVRRNVPPHVAAAVSCALERVPADRFASAHEFAEALNNSSLTLSPTSATAGRDWSPRRLGRLLYGATALAILATIVGLWGWMRPAGSKGVVRYSLGLDSTEAMVPGGDHSGRLAISPDGSRLAYIGGPHGQLLVRQRNQLHAIAIPGTEGANTPFFSPDGKRVGFVVIGKGLQFVAVNGGPPIIVTDSSIVGTSGESWGRDGFIYADASVDGGLVRIEDKPGGVPKWFTALDTARGEIDHTQPDVLPNGKGVLFTVTVKGATAFAVAVADVASGRHRVIVNGAMYPRYAAPGQLLYVTSNGTLMTAPFDQNSMKITGEPTALVEGMRRGLGGSTDLGVSDDGTLVYAIGARQGNELVWVTRDGKAQSVDPEWQAGDFAFPALSPNGKQLAVTRIRSGQPLDIWIKQLDRGSSTRLTLDGRDNCCPTWTPDGRSVTFTSEAAKGDLVTKRADGSAQEIVHLHKDVDLYNARWSPDGKWLVFQTDVSSPGSRDIYGIRRGVDSAPVPLVATRFTELGPALSPDGRWLAYTSDESGEYEIYVVPFPKTSTAKWAVSTHGGTEPLWSHGGRELFYRDRPGNLVAVEVKTSPTFFVGRTTLLFPAGGFVSDNSSLEYAVAPNDRRFLMIRPLATGTPDKLIVVENWFEELKAKSQK